MTAHSIEVERPNRWDYPLSESILKDDVAWLLQQAPFSLMDQERFARNTPLSDILRNDARLLHLRPGDVIFREGQYGGTAYLVLTGNARIFLTKLLTQADPESGQRSRRSWLKLLAETLPGSRGDRPSHNRVDSRRRARPDRATASASAEPAAVGYRGQGTETRIFLQDVPRVLEQHATSSVHAGELFGEMAAVTRSPREYTAVAETESILLEVRWQGLKLLQQDPAFRQLLDERYRSEILRTHLRETMLFRFIPEESLQKVVEAARMESFGNLEWYAEYRQGLKQPARQRIAAEPLIAEEGSYAVGLWIVRGGFARLSRRQGAGHRTLAYLGKGQVFGLRELAQNFHNDQAVPLPYQESLRAIGYVDALCIPKQVVNEHILPFVRHADLPEPLLVPRYQFNQPVVDAPLETHEHNVEAGLLEFLVDQRLMNGQQAMVIDTERCTRCDDCVRACAKTHHGTPVFVRQGPQYGPWLFAQACMHCEDPVCMIGCPTGAIHRDHESGLVQINAQTCIGCKTCAESCPYDNIRMVNATNQQGRPKVDQANGLPILLASK
ncbi:MAG: cyclic nucleotide-binding domain-containing protein, partial [Planctomycetales bacterium]|nr:cyclic nucleotide-binding domain-containing protein [Planctomycetales bacterium]